jgi:hypothetical protein
VVAGGEVFAGGGRFRGRQFGYLRMGGAPHALGAVSQREAGVRRFIIIRPFFAKMPYLHGSLIRAFGSY